MPSNWDGKTRPTNDTYRSNYDDIFGKKKNMNIRLMFEPKPGVKCNVDKMFQYYGENYLSDFPEFSFGGYIILNTLEHKHNTSLSGEPFYQFIANKVTKELLDKVCHYVKINPMEGYHVHVHYSEKGENEKAVA